MKRLLFLVVAIMSIGTACTSLQRNYDVQVGNAPAPGTTAVSTASATSMATATAAADCHPQDASATIVAMSFSIAPATVTGYGVLFGYTATDSTGTFNNTATVIAVAANSSVQFANGDSAAPTTIDHSAVGFVGNAFPATPFTFPAVLAAPAGTALSSRVAWSTGRLPGMASCFSQSFTVPTGTYYFGDYDYYSGQKMRGVIVAS